jgi:mannose-6-phosphate isomerase-like protein (cupin superfamily)
MFPRPFSPQRAGIRTRDRGLPRLIRPQRQPDYVPMAEAQPIPRTRRGDVIENTVTGERAIVLVGTEDSQDGKVVAFLGVRPGGAVVGEHVHRTITERFRVVCGRLCVRIDGVESVLGPGDDLTVLPGTVHDWWNAGDEEAQLVVEIDPGRRFEIMLSTLFGLANDGLTNDKGMPHLLQAAVIAQEFRDVVEFVRPPRFIQRALFAVLAPIGRALGYRPTYERYLRPHARVEVVPELLALVDELPQAA